ncbi:Der1ER1 [Toxoplasma gondii MAS]|uniref:Derlin n=2 Tax=Toxoplasma gondii TaxID=5811 RepID=A0A086QNY8_TOXGO|nr:Der1ER1 [Toxoplasma gondii MAS]PUA86843.1 Der1ER1 [Toxoplasma gondii TgCATBr9]
MDPLPHGVGSGGGYSSNGPEAWFFSLPPVTRAVTCITFACTLLSSIELMPARLLILDWELVFQKLQVWRLLTNVLYIGRFSLGWVLHMYMWTQVSSDLENNAVFVQASKGAYLYFIVLQTLCLDCISLLLFWPTGLHLLGGSLLFAVLYYWSRRESYTPVSIYFLTVQGHQLPFVLLLLHLLMGKDLWSDAIGLLSGHIYYFFREILPAQGGADLLSYTPKMFDRLAERLSNRPEVGRRPAANRTGTASTGAGGGGPGGPGGSTWGGSVRPRPAAGGSGTQAFSGRGYRIGSD